MTTDKKLIECTPIQGTPFNLVKKENDEFVAFGNYRLHTGNESISLTLQKIEEKNWTIIMEVISIMIDINNKNQKQ